MKHSQRTLLAGLAACALSLPLSAATALAAEHKHEHDHHPAKLQLNKGKKWETDAPLRANMESMRNEIAGKVEAIHKGKLGKDEYAALGRAIEGHVGNLVSQCKLAPDADAMLHIVVADLLAASDTMQGKAAGKPDQAAHKAVLALNAYGRHFDHPGWKPIK